MADRTLTARLAMSVALLILLVWLIPFSAIVSIVQVLKAIDEVWRRAN